MPDGTGGDGGPAASARFNFPRAVAVDLDGNLLVAEFGSGRIRKLSRGADAAAPAISPNGIVNSASYGAPSPTGMISIFGSNLARSTVIASLDDLSIGTGLGSTQVLVNGNPAPLLVVSPGQINAIVPPVRVNSASPGAWAFVVDVDGVQSQPVTFPSSFRNTLSPGLFSADASGTGPGAIVNQDVSLNSSAQPAPRGSIVSLYWTGFSRGYASGYLNIGHLFFDDGTHTSATVGGQPAEVLYAGDAPWLLAGAGQINIRIPATAKSGLLDVVVTVSGIASNKVGVWVQ
jgi:uncharacterized protein (TIGR03437 family)